MQRISNFHIRMGIRSGVIVALIQEIHGISMNPSPRLHFMVWPTCITTYTSVQVH